MIRVVRLGEPRVKGEGLRLGTVRRPPRGVKKQDYGRLDYYDLWLPELAPSAELVAFAMKEELTPARWKTFSTRYRSEMKKQPAARFLELVVAMSREANLSVGCYCEDEARCHRSVLRAILEDHGAKL